MALWGISTTQETWANNYAIPKFLDDQDRNNTPHNCFADDRGWIYRRYSTDTHSGLGTIYTDEVLVPIAGLNTVAAASTTFRTGLAVTFGSDSTNQVYTGLAPATPVSVFFEDPNNNSEITVAAGGTTGVLPAATVKVNVVYNELVFVSTGATINIITSNVLDGGGNVGDGGAGIVGYAETAVGDVAVFSNTNGTAGGEYEIYNLTGEAGTDFAGQITNRVSFAFTAPAATALLTENDQFAEVNIDFASADGTGGVGVATTTFFVAAADLEGVVAGVSSATLENNLGIAFTEAPVIAVGDTSFTIGGPTGLAITIRDQQGAGIGNTVLFSNLTAMTKLRVDMDRGIVGTVTSLLADDTAAIKTFINAGVATSPGAALPIGIDRQVGGAGTFMSGSFLENASTLTVDGTGVVGLGTTTIQVSPASTTF
jgi:hypothetical protein